MKKLIILLILFLPCVSFALPNVNQMEWFQSTLNTGSPYDSLRQKILVDTVTVNAIVQIDSTLKDSFKVNNAILRTIRDTTNEISQTLRDSMNMNNILLRAIRDSIDDNTDSIGVTNSILRTVRDTTNEISQTLRDSLASVISELRTLNDNVYDTAIADTFSLGTVARQLPNHSDCRITIQNITSGATVYVGDSSGQYSLLLYLDTFSTGEISNSNIFYVRSSQANTDIAIIGVKK